MWQVERLTILVSKRDKEYLRQLARSEGETMSVVVRRVIREAIRKLEEEGKENANVQKQ
jgi:hypothetical protein